jgi:cold shock protein
MATGTVKWFTYEMGYGFILPDGGGPDEFVHFSALEKAGLQVLVKGQRIEFSRIPRHGRDGRSMAGNLKLIA